MHGTDIPYEIKRNEIPLEKFSAIVAENEVNLKIEYSDIFMLESVWSIYDSAYKFPEYKIQNDTLYFYKSNSVINPNLKCNSIKTIIAKKGNRIRLDDFKTDSLSLEITEGEVYGSFKEGTSIESMNIRVKQNSRINLNSSTINSAKVIAEQSVVNLYNNKIDSIRVDLSNNSTLYAEVENILSVKKDSTSEYTIRGVKE